jgi:hypothetical protein
MTSASDERIERRCRTCGDSLHGLLNGMGVMKHGQIWFCVRHGVQADLNEQPKHHDQHPVTTQ